MSIVPNTTCRRCHRQYPSFRGRCPYCGTKKAREVRSAVPETDSAVPGTQAARNAAEAVNYQMLIGGVLLLAVIIATIVIVSVNISGDVAEQQQFEEQLQTAQDTTAIPVPTPTPSPTPTAAPQITSLEVRWGSTGIYDYVALGGFNLPSTSTISLYAIWYPSTITAIPEWTVDDETIVSISPNESGIICEAVMVGDPGQQTTLHIKVNEYEADMVITIT